MPKVADERIEFKNYILTLIDFLGQRSELGGWSTLPTSKAEYDRFLSAVKATYGQIEWARSEYEKLATTWLLTRDVPASLAAILPDQGQAYKEYSDTSLDFMHFSDTIVAFSPVVNRFGHGNMSSVLGHLLIVGMLMLEALAQRRVFRGGIELGVAATMNHGGIYGPVLAGAHYLESEIAKCPRILVGETLINYVELQALDESHTAGSGIAKICKTLIVRDSDRLPIVDYAGKGFENIAIEKEGWRWIRRLAKQFVSAEARRFDADAKLGPRYRLLNQYLEGSH